MYRNAAVRVSSLFASTAAAVFLAAVPGLASEMSSKAPTVGFAARHGESAPLRDYRPVGPFAIRPNREIPNEATPRKGGAGYSKTVSDPVVQRQFGLSQPEPSVQFEGASDDDNAAVVGFRIVPPDTEGDVGPGHYVQYINNVAVIYDKAGNIVLGPFPGNAFWDGLGGPCEIQNDGDPLVRYDRQADRWVFSQFALPNFPDGPFYQCFAVSRRTIRRAFTGSTSSRRATTFSPTTERSASGRTRTTCRSTCSAPPASSREERTPSTARRCSPALPRA